MFALADGAEQEKRNIKLLAGEDYQLFEWLWGYDAIENGRKAWKRFLDEKYEYGAQVPSYH